MADNIEEKWWRAAHHEAGHVLALFSYGIIPAHVDISIRGGGYTAVEYLPEDWTAEQEDSVTLAGVVAEHIYRHDIDEFIHAIRHGTVSLSGEDGRRVHEQDARAITRQMTELKEYFLNRRWELVQEIAEALMARGAIDDEDIEAIYLENIGSDSIGRIAKNVVRQELLYLTYY